VEADSAFRLALQRLSSDEPNEGLAYLARVIRLDRRNDAARTLLYTQFLTRSWPVPVRKFGPEGRIGGAVFSNDGARAVFRSGEFLEMWDVVKGQRIGRLDAGFDAVSFALASDGWTVLVSPGAYGKGDQLALWNPARGRTITYAEVRRLPGLGACDLLRTFDVSAGGEVAVDCLGLTFASFSGRPASGTLGRWQSSRFGPDPRFVVANAGADAVLDRQQPARGVIEPALHSGDFAGGFSRDGKRIAVGRGLMVDVVELASGKRLTGFENQSAAQAATFDPTGRFVMTIAEDDCIRLWDASDGTMMFEPVWHGAIREAAFSNDGSRLLTASDRLASWWSARDGTSSGAPVTAAGRMLTAHFDTSGSIVTVSRREARVWQLASAVLPPALSEGADKVNGLSADRSRVLVTREGRFSAFDSRSGEKLWTVPEEQSPVAASADGSRILLTGADDRISLYETRTWRMLWQLPPGMVFPSFSRDGAAVLIQTDKTIAVRSAATGAPLAPPIDAPFGSLRGSSNDGSVLVLRSDDTIRVWDVRRRRALLSEPDKEDAAIALSPDGRRLAVASRTGLRVFELADGSVRTAPHQEDERLYRVVFSPDGQRLATALENSVVLCDAGTLQCADEAFAHADVTEMELSADGRRILTATDKEVRVWDTATKRPLTHALPREERAPIGLSPDGAFVFSVKGGELYRIPLPSLDDDDAERLAALGEAIAGAGIDRLGVTTPVDGIEALATLADQCGAIQSPTCDIVRWLRTPPEKRSVSPVSKVMPAGYAKRGQ
jgi:WD40 repeat protein